MKHTLKNRNSPLSVVFIGSGNVAWHLSQSLYEAGHRILQVYSRTLSHAEELAQRVEAEAITTPEALNRCADAYIISVSDDAISEVAEMLRPFLISDNDAKIQVVIHTAGSISIDALSRASEHAAVLYPMQTFTKRTPVNFSEIPLFVEATDNVSENVVQSLANSISEHVVTINSDQRCKLHLAAVFASNMTNHCYRLAERIVNEAGIDFSLYAPLIRETARKASVMSPRDAQTGPMARGDVKVMNKQLGMLSDPLMKKIYELFARSIRKDKENFQTARNIQTAKYI